MRMRDVLAPKGYEVFAISADATLHEAVRTLVDRNIGSLVVLNGSDLIGIITERDLLRVTAADPGLLRTARVGGTMTRELITARLDDALADAMERMTRNRIRHLPVLEDDRLRGLVSIGDLVFACLQETRFENEQLQSYIQGTA